MQIKYRDRVEQHICICREFDKEVYYSELHAEDNGWMKTSDPRCVAPDGKFIWMCPRCLNFNWEQDD